MGGFKNQHLNHIGRQRIFNTIVTVLIKSCSKMVSDCVASGEKLQNHEEKIRNYLLENYLSNDSFKKELKIKLPLLFIPEVPEKFIPCSNTYEGRIDIKVFSNDIFNNRNDYYIVECKRIDGTSSLYQKYVDEGIERFVADNPKYSSYNNIKGKQHLKTLEKYYAVDIGLRYMLLGSRSTDIGHILENIIYLELIRRGYEVYVGKVDELEVDFVAVEHNRTIYYQVAATVRDESTLQRELAPLQKINDHYQKFILTLDEDPEADYDGIRRINALEWLMGEIG